LEVREAVLAAFLAIVESFLFVSWGSGGW